MSAKPTEAMISMLAKIAEAETRNGAKVDVAGPEWRAATVVGLRERGLITVEHERDRSVETQHGRGASWYVSTNHKVPVLIATITPAGRALLSQQAEATPSQQRLRAAMQRLGG